MDLITLLLACEVWLVLVYTLFKREFFACQISSWYISIIMLVQIGVFLTICALDLTYIGLDVQAFARTRTILAIVITAICGSYVYLISRPVY